jgi:hypothetical protein
MKKYAKCWEVGWMRRDIGMFLVDGEYIIHKKQPMMNTSSTKSNPKCFHKVCAYIKHNNNIN